MAISEEWKDTIITVIILTVLLLMLSVTGCTLFGSSTAPDLTNKLQTDLRQTRKEVVDIAHKVEASSKLQADSSDEMSAQYKEVSGTVSTLTTKVNNNISNVSSQLSTITNRIETNSTDISTVSSNVSNINQNNTPFWQIFLPIIGAYFLWEVLKYKVIRRKKNA